MIASIMNLVERQLENGGIVLELDGEADLAAAPLVQARVRAIKEKSVPFLIFDFSKTTFVNTPIWAAVVEYFQHTNAKGGKLAVAGLHGRVEASFQVVRLGGFIASYPTVEEAAAALSA